MSTPATSLLGVMEAIAADLQPLADVVEGLQVVPYLNPNPTPPSIDIYPGAPFQTDAGFIRYDEDSGQVTPQRRLHFTIRARVSTADVESGQRLLLRMLDPTDPASVEAALVDSAVVESEGVSEFREYIEDTAENGRLLGAEWTVTTFL